jgi:hypothetical protein
MQVQTGKQATGWHMTWRVFTFMKLHSTSICVTEV